MGVGVVSSFYFAFLYPAGKMLIKSVDNAGEYLSFVYSSFWSHRILIAPQKLPFVVRLHITSGLRLT